MAKKYNGPAWFETWYNTNHTALPAGSKAVAHSSMPHIKIEKAAAPKSRKHPAQVTGGEARKDWEWPGEYLYEGYRGD